MANEKPTADILTDEDFAMLEEAEEAGKVAKELILRAKEAQVDLGDMPERLESSLTQARAIKRAFFPGRAL